MTFARSLMLIGGLIATQNVVNPALSRFTGPVLAILISSSITALIMLVITLMGFGGQKASFSNLWQAPIYLWVGGILGAGILSGAVFLLPKVGAANYVAFMVAGQLIFAMLLDQIGAFGMTKFPITGTRLLGAVILLVGARLIMVR